MRFAGDAVSRIAAANKTGPGSPEPTDRCANGAAVRPCCKNPPHAPPLSSLRSRGASFLAKLSTPSAVSRQFGLSPERRSGFVSHRLLGLLGLKCLPTLHEPQPKCPVAGIARTGGKAAAFIGAPPKLFYTHFQPPCRPGPFLLESEALRISGRKPKNCIQSPGTDLLNFSRGFPIWLLRELRTAIRAPTRYPMASFGYGPIAASAVSAPLSASPDVQESKERFWRRRLFVRGHR
jgi:hypothetical protein